jgi:Ribbon-helix-helix protein, copG family
MKRTELKRSKKPTVPKRNKKQGTSLSLVPELREQLTQRAIAEDVSANKVMERALRMYLATPIPSTAPAAAA